jgi:hypothetical protein
MLKCKIIWLQNEMNGHLQRGKSDLHHGQKTSFSLHHAISCLVLFFLFLPSAESHSPVSREVNIHAQISSVCAFAYISCTLTRSHTKLIIPTCCAAAARWRHRRNDLGTVTLQTDIGVNVRLPLDEHLTY